MGAGVCIDRILKLKMKIQLALLFFLQASANVITKRSQDPEIDDYDIQDFRRGKFPIKPIIKVIGLLGPGIIGLFDDEQS